MNVNKRDLSAILGVSERTLTEWQAVGLPIKTDGERGQANGYETVDVIRWLVTRELRKVQFESQRDRLTRLQADDMEMTIATKRGTLIAADQIEPAWLAMVASAKAFLRAESDALAQLLEVTEGVDAKRNILQETFDECLFKLSRYEPEEDEEPIT